MDLLGSNILQYQSQTRNSWTCEEKKTLNHRIKDEYLTFVSPPSDETQIWLHNLDRKCHNLHRNVRIPTACTVSIQDAHFSEA